MAHFARCPECGAINDEGAQRCYLCNTSPLLVDCPCCGEEVRNPVLTRCPSCGVHYEQFLREHSRRRPREDVGIAG